MQINKIFYAIIIAGVLIAGAIYFSGYFKSSNGSKTLYSLPSCSSSDCDCGDFSTHAYAQWFHDNYDLSDKHRLDGNKDGVVCESLP